ncbi:hypothetical protein RB195_012389 [Necator americanus]|uniref:Uncharacterized protein n=1 Tax=Necator americanus TaxID=51031 RepID=A0ABR1D9X2_NECAM
MISSCAGARSSLREFSLFKFEGPIAQRIALLSVASLFFAVAGSPHTTRANLPDLHRNGQPIAKYLDLIIRLSPGSAGRTQAVCTQTHIQRRMNMRYGIEKLWVNREKRKKREVLSWMHLCVSDSAQCRLRVRTEQLPHARRCRE